MLKIKVIACDVLNREISFLSSQSGCFIDVSFVHQGLHAAPQKLNGILQDEIIKANSEFPYDRCGDSPQFDYIVLAYGLCCNAIAGLTSERIPMAVPRGHDCITLLLGSLKKYLEFFSQCPCTYWLSSGWIERGKVPSKEWFQYIDADYQKRFGEENAEYLLQNEKQCLSEYKNCIFIEWESLKSEFFKSRALDISSYNSWEMKSVIGDCSLLKRMLNGIFKEEEVLLVPPGRKILPAYDDKVITFE